MLSSIVLIFLKIALGFLPAKAAGSPKSLPDSWYRYLQYTSKKPDVSLIKAPSFFQSNQLNNPEAEYQTSLELFRKGEKLCDFPARKTLIEKISGEKFPHGPCPDLDRWRKAFGGQKIWIVYAGAYFNNPASLFGHTFLRFDKKSEQDQAQSLRSQSVGFLANTPPQDGQTETVFKGLFGFYQGFYNIQPYYMQTALYNNSESRSLWEYELTLTEEEGQWAVDYLWELSEKSSMTYWFMDENCSFQLLAFLEAVRPHVHLTKSTGLFVLPLETVRILNESKMLKDQSAVYQNSIRSRWQALLRQMTSSQRKQYRKARKDLKTLDQTQDLFVLEALTEFQTFYNYQKKTQLNPHEREIFEKTFAKRAALQVKGDFSLEQKIPVNPLESRRPGHVQIGIQNHDVLSLSGKLGAHDVITSLHGKEDASSIEYLGYELRQNVKESEIDSYQILLARVKTLNSWSLEEPQFSWAVEGFWKEERFKDQWQRGLDSSAGGGFSFISLERAWVFSIMAQAKVGLDNVLGVGPWALLRHENSFFTLALQHGQVLTGPTYLQETTLELMPYKAAKYPLVLRAQKLTSRPELYEIALRLYF